VVTELHLWRQSAAWGAPKSEDGDGRVVVTDKECEHSSVTASSGGPTFSPNAEVPESETSRGTALEGKCVAELIALLVRKGARVVIQTEDRR
jgi:hypothetical protein